MHSVENLNAAKHNPKRIIIVMFSVLPQTLFVLMPMFAVLLKIVYIFKRCLYMEHLIATLHSHAFIFQSLLLIALFGVLSDWVGDRLPSLATALGYLQVAA